MVSIVIPVLNEGATIRKVIKIIRKTSIPHEIIVVDDNSTDNTISEALKESVRILTSSQRGKGLSMREGLLAAKYDTIVYLDGDITTYPNDVIDLLTNPILEDRADFVKSCFARQAGRVTQLVAKPLLSILFPELSSLDQPLSGMIAAKKSLLEKISFEKDYGVDIGLLIDIHKLGARIEEVNIGRVQNAMQSLEQLGKMSKQVSRTILRKADAEGLQSLATIGEINLISRQLESSVLESFEHMKKMVLLEMDEVVLNGRYLAEAAKQLGLTEKLMPIVSSGAPAKEKIKEIAAVFNGVSLPELLEIADDMPLVKGVHEVIAELKKRGYSVGLVSEIFSFVANHVKNKLGIDFVISNQLVLDDGIVTGELELAPYFEYELNITENGSISENDYGKEHLFSHIQDRHQLHASNIVYVTASRRDHPCLQRAGIGYFFQSPDLKDLLQIIPGAENKDAWQGFPNPSKPATLVLPSLFLAAMGLLIYSGWSWARKNPPETAGC
ncbi:glycosyltransferase [Flavihumibacter sp. UBA7668]|uniref:glycosyltransferase n=1 Tax=Flavihumibacter sp. UBA7668 TaxID=1946542 RepID=UPI0025BC76FA|nr:glycosyltransferase [Flavihumibacter sp. UBA7668]